MIELARAGLRRLPLAVVLALVVAASAFGILTFLVVIVIFPNQGLVAFPLLSWLGCPGGGDLTLNTRWGRRGYSYFTLGYTCTSGAGSLPANELRMFLALALFSLAAIIVWWVLDTRQARLARDV